MNTIEINKVFLIGNLGRDPEKRYTPNGQAVTNVTLATTSRWKDKTGQNQERTDWHNLVIWGKQAETAKEILKKGDQVFVEGRIQSRSWETKDGEKRNTLEIVAQRVQFLSRGGMDMHHHETATSEAGGKTAAGGAKETGGK